MKDHHPTPDARNLALRERRRGLLQPSAGDAPDLLPVPIIYGTYNGGLGRDQLLGDFDSVNISVGPWDYADLTDTIYLHWGDQWHQTFPVTSTVGAQLLTLPGIYLAGDPIGNGDHYTGEGTQGVWYEVKPQGGALQPSAVQDVIVKTARPGGEDPRPDTPVNDNLAAPTADPNPVQQDTAAVIFSVVPWRNITTDDKLTLVLAGVTFDFPAVTDTTLTQTLTLTAEQIAATGGGPSTPVTYQVIDHVGNRSRYAPYLLLDIWLEAGDRLEMIMLFDDAGKPINGAIDPAMTQGVARVPRYAGWKPGESVTVFLDGVASDEQPHNTTLGPITWSDTDYYLDFALPADYLPPLAGGIVRAYYKTSSDGIAYRRLYIVDALPETNLPPVTVIGEQNGELPLAAIAGDYVSIAIPDSEPFVDLARITLTMEGTGDNGPVLEKEIHNVGEGEGHQPYAFTWLKTRLTPLLEHTATFSYTIRTLDDTQFDDTQYDGAPLDGAPRLYQPTGIRGSEPHHLLIRETGSPAQLAPPLVHDLVDGVVSPTLPKLRLTVPAGTASVAGATVIANVAGLTTDTHTVRIFDDGEAVVVDFPGWPALNDGASAKAWYTIDGKPSQEASFLVGEPEPFTIDESEVALNIAGMYTREASGGVKPYTYVSSNPTFVKVPNANEGIIQGVAEGNAIITASDAANHSASYPVSVSADFAIDQSTMTLTVGGSSQRQATGGTTPYSYTSANPAIASVIASTGAVTANAAGSTSITARDAASHSASYPVSVTAAFAIDQSTMTLTVGGSSQRQATGGTTPYSYTSANPAIASVNASTGAVTATGAGTTLITARDAASQSAAYPVLVVTAFAIDDSLVSLTGTASYTRAATGGVPPYTYTSSNSTIIRVPNSSEGVIQAVADGKATITARDSASGSGSYPVSVGPEPPKPIKPPIGLPTVDGMVNGTLHSSYGVMRVRAPNYPDITSGDKIDYVWERSNQAAFGESVWVDGTLVVPPGTFDMPFVLGKQTVWYWVIRGPYALKSGSVEFQVVYP